MGMVWWFGNLQLDLAKSFLFDFVVRLGFLVLFCAITCDWFRCLAGSLSIVVNKNKMNVI